jgi:hypothetical protein
MQMATTEQQETAAAATAVLAQSSVAELRRLRVDETANRLQLSGRVSSFYHKQLAQELVRSVAGEMQMVNRVDVCR